MITIDIPIWSARLRAHRRARMWSRQELGQQMAEAADEETRDRLPAQEGLTWMVHSWETGERRPDERYAELLCRALDMDEAGLFSGEAAGTTLWHHLTGIPLLPELFSPEDEERTGRAIENPRRADDQTVAYFEAVLRTYARTDLRPAGLINALAPIFDTLEGLHRDARSSVRQTLLRLSSQDAELISRMHHEAGDLKEALAWSDRALLAAHQAGDEQLVASTLAHRAGLQDTRSNPEQVIDLAVAARRHLGPPTPLDTMAYRHEAHGHAMAGAEDMCHRRLEESAESPVDMTGDTPSAFDYPLGLHHTLAAGCLITLHHPDDAIEILEHDLPGAPPTYMTAYNLACLAHAYADAHEGERSASVAHEAFAMSRRTGATRALRELHLIRDDISRWSHQY
ncbi:hypothetical protein [Streptosporangium sp. NPDC000396]|uniref:hypothetical protein n=1 Tax=Streptosporangium sp. NPDC000396 TaxID=3366185 RepID=UPI003691F695